MFKINGLRWEEHYRLPNNGPDSFVIPLATNDPINLVYHGSKTFDYGHYGIHLGQQDQLTFLGPSTKIIKAAFIDCRSDSSSFGQKEWLEFKPTTRARLVIPPGVGHTFFGLENVFTVNDYQLFLPPVQNLKSGSGQWDLAADVINIPLDVSNNQLPRILVNQYRASSQFHDIVRELVADQLSKGVREHPIHYDIKDASGVTKRVAIRRKNLDRNTVKEQKIAGIFGLRWEHLAEVSTGDDSGIVPFLGSAPLQIIDHGERYYATDSYGIHCGQEDRLVFVGHSSKKFRIKLLDCRANSPTLHHKVELLGQPHPRRCLVIPPGVAHGFSELEGIYTLNRPRYYTDAKGSYRPGSDVWDWPYEKQPYPQVLPYRIPVDREFYDEQVQGIARLVSKRAPITTATGFWFHDRASAKDFKLVLRKKNQ